LPVLEKSVKTLLSATEGGIFFLSKRKDAVNKNIEATTMEIEANTIKNKIIFLILINYSAVRYLPLAVRISNHISCDDTHEISDGSKDTVFFPVVSPLFFSETFLFFTMSFRIISFRQIRISFIFHFQPKLVQTLESILKKKVMPNISGEKKKQNSAHGNCFPSWHCDSKRKRNHKKKADKHGNDEMSDSLALDDRYLRPVKKKRVIPIYISAFNNLFRPSLMPKQI
jgi:hypothetical protein